MAFGPFSSESRAKEVTTVVSDEGRLVSGKRAVLTESGSIGLGAGAKFLEPGSADLSGIKGSVQLGGLNLAGATGTTITTTDADLARDTTKILGGLLADANKERAEASQGLSESLAEANRETGSVLSGAIEKLGGLLRGQETGGQTDILKPLLIFGIAALVLVGTVIYFTRR